MISAVWIAALALLLASAPLAVLGSFLWPAVLLVGLSWLILGLAAYLWRHGRFMATLRRAEALVDRGDVAAARGLLAPLFERYPSLTLVQKAAAAALYAGADPLSAAQLYERVAKRTPRDEAVTIGLVAAYAALNKVGDARRAAKLAPTSVDVRLALAWAELVAVGGDRRRGAVLARELRDALALDRAPGRRAMSAALAAIVDAREGHVVRALDQLRSAEREREALPPPDRAFVGYLGGVALRETGATADARTTFEHAMEAAPGTIGEALARRERSQLPRAQPSSGAPSDQPSAD